MSPPGSEQLTFWGVSFIFRDSRQDSLGQGHEGFVDVDLIFGRGLEELHAETVGELLALLVRHLSLVFQVALVADQNLDDVRTGVLSDFAEPGLDVLERLTVGNIVD